MRVALFLILLAGLVSCGDADVDAEGRKQIKFAPQLRMELLDFQQDGQGRPVGRPSPGFPVTSAHYSPLATAVIRLENQDMRVLEVVALQFDGPVMQQIRNVVTPRNPLEPNEIREIRVNLHLTQPDARKPRLPLTVEFVGCRMAKYVWGEFDEPQP